MDSMILWNILISLVFAPIFYSIRSQNSEIQRINILVNRTREEIARDYVTRTSFNVEFERMMCEVECVFKNGA